MKKLKLVIITILIGLFAFNMNVKADATSKYNTLVNDPALLQSYVLQVNTILLEFQNNYSNPPMILSYEDAEVMVMIAQANPPIEAYSKLVSGEDGQQIISADDAVKQIYNYIEIYDDLCEDVTPIAVDNLTPNVEPEPGQSDYWESNGKYWSGDQWKFHVDRINNNDETVSDEVKKMYNEHKSEVDKIIADYEARNTPSNTESNNESNTGGSKDLGYVGDNFCQNDRTKQALKLIGYFVLIAKIAVPLIIIVIGILDLYKGVVDGDGKKISTGAKTILIRVAVGILLFFLPNLFVAILDGLLPDEYSLCSHCVLSPTTNCEVVGGNTYTGKPGTKTCGMYSIANCPTKDEVGNMCKPGANKCEIKYAAGTKTCGTYSIGECPAKDEAGHTCKPKENKCVEA